MTYHGQGLRMTSWSAGNRESITSKKTEAGGGGGGGGLRPRTGERRMSILGTGPERVPFQHPTMVLINPLGFGHTPCSIKY